MNDPSIQLLEKIKALQKHLDRLDLLEPSSLLARYHTATAQSFANNALNIINYDTKDYDTHNAVTIGASWVFTAPIGGYYLVTASILFSTTVNCADGEDGNMRLYKNGGAVSYIARKDNYGTAVVIPPNMYMHLQGSDVVYLAAGETTNVLAQQNSGGTLTLHPDANWNYIAIHKI